MKNWLVAVVASMLVLSACASNSQKEPNNEETKEPITKTETPKQEDTMVEAQPNVQQIVNGFYNNEVVKTEDEQNKEDVVKELEKYASSEFVATFIQDYFNETDSKLTLIPMDPPLYMDTTKEMDLEPLSNTEYVASQTNTTDMDGTYTIQTTFEVIEDKWKITGVQFEYPESEKEGGNTIAANYDSVEAVINKEFHLPDDYIPADLVEPTVPFPFEEDLPKKLLRQEAATALEEMFEGAKADGIELLAASGYRSFETQDYLFEAYAAEHGEEAANKFSARPGQSEHQTGLAMDVTSRSAGYAIGDVFGETVEGDWVANHAWEYGFIIRYLEGKEDITGYKYEPWHLRYVGKDLAQKVYEAGVTLEEYFGL
ncbi:M15 family metallopeptidase [Bacillus coahuilensis]|uniref:M15 family metallopeptidase n=1 Tax=Bacillus coahuilensis TaxID=408580 RepID=UPI0001851274|nr:M15 family metallopeptidase [Bacillus coahuilensis]